MNRTEIALTVYSMYTFQMCSNHAVEVLWIGLIYITFFHGTTIFAAIALPATLFILPVTGCGKKYELPCFFSAQTTHKWSHLLSHIVPAAGPPASIGLMLKLRGRLGEVSSWSNRFHPQMSSYTPTFFECSYL